MRSRLRRRPGTGVGNYTVTYVNGRLTVTPAPLTVTADDLTRGFGQANPALTYTITTGSLFNGDALSGNLATTANATSVAGPYPITQGTLAGSANYTLTFVDGILTVIPATATPNFGVSPDMFINANTIVGGGRSGAPTPLQRRQHRPASPPRPTARCSSSATRGPAGAF